MTEQASRNTRSQHSEGDFLEDETIEIPRGVSLPTLVRPFLDRDPLEWHRVDDWLSLDDGMSAALLTSAVDTGRFLRAVEGGTAALPAYSPASGESLGWNEGRAFRAFPVAVSSRREGRDASHFEWLIAAGAARALDPHVRAFCSKCLREINRYRIDGFDFEGALLGHVDGMPDGQPHVAVLTELMGNDLVALPVVTSERQQELTTWYLAERSAMGGAFVEPWNAQAELRAIHLVLWDRLTNYLPLLGHRWSDALQSLAHARGLVSETLRDQNESPVVKIAAPAQLDSPDRPLALLFSLDNSGAGNGEVVLRCEWAHHSPLRLHSAPK